jgi:hypothetical protein
MKWVTIIAYLAPISHIIDPDCFQCPICWKAPAKLWICSHKSIRNDPTICASYTKQHKWIINESCRVSAERMSEEVANANTMNLLPFYCVSFNTIITYIHTYHSRFIPKGEAEAFQILLPDAHVLPNCLAMMKTADMTRGKSIAVYSQCILGVSAINPLVAFYNIHWRKREVLFFCPVPDTIRD